MSYPEHSALIDALKKQLKNRDIRYAQIADGLSVSLATVKRIFCGEDCNIQRLMDICDLAGVRFFDLVELARTEHSSEYFLSAEQEDYFAANPKNFAAFRLIHRAWREAEIREEIVYTDHEWATLLRELEAIKLVQRDIDGRFKSTIQGQLRWELNGNLAKTVMRKQNIDFLDFAYDDIENPTHCFMAGESFFSKNSVKDLISDLQALGRKFRARSWKEENMLRKSDLVPVRTLIVAAPYRANWL